MSLFTKVRGLHPKRHLHNLTHDNLVAHDMGNIVPCFVMEHCIPGSKLEISYSQLTRFQALLAPIMSNIDTHIRFFKVPYRLIDPQWTRFIAGEAEINEDFLYNPPYFTYQGLRSYLQSGETLSDFLGEGTLLDFLGYAYTGSTQTTSGFTQQQNIRAIQAYCMILRYWYINENISSTDFDSLLSLICDFCPDVYEVEQNGYLYGDVSENVYMLIKALKVYSPSGCFPHAWGKDYFTSALPYVQVGDPVRLSLADTAPVNIPRQAAIFSGTAKDGQEIKADFSHPVHVTPSEPAFVGWGRGTFSGNPSLVWADADVDYNPQTQSGAHMATAQGTLKRLEGEIGSFEGTADLSDATAISILELRIANALQSYKELTARIGHRYNEYLKGTFNVDSRDARLQLPERLGGGRVPVNIADIEQTSGSGANNPDGTNKTPLGWLAGKATAFGARMKPIRTYIEEDCLVIGVMYTQPKSRNYCLQGINRFKTKLTDRFDFFHPKFEHIGEQAIMTTELFAGAPKTEVFGYQARYAEYKWWPNEVHGQFNTTLDFWHLARKFANKPTLSPEFIYVMQSEMSRPFAVQNIDGKSLQQCMTWLRFDVAYLAPMSKDGTPMLLN